MKKLVLTCTMLLAIVSFSASANAETNTNQMCLKFTAFCDGVQILAGPGPNLASEWYHFDCANSAPMTSGTKEGPISNACPGGNGKGLVSCNNCGGFGDWHFVLDSPLDGTMDMVNGQNPGGSCWIDELTYAVQIGNCTGLQGRGERQNAQRKSTVQ